MPPPEAFRAFDAAFLPWMRRRIAGIHIAGLPLAHPPDRPLIIVSNHVSWWDGFLLRQVQWLLRPGAPLHIVMLEHELQRRPLLGMLGAVGIDPRKPGSVVRTLRLLAERLERRPDSVVLYFPQGKIWPSHRRALGFQRGIELFARHLPPADILPVGIHLEPLAAPAPHAFVAAAGPLAARTATAAALESVVERELDSIFGLLARYGEDAPAQWPGVHGSLDTRSRSGVSAPLARAGR